jgi:hypothetical protein
LFKDRDAAREDVAEDVIRAFYPEELKFGIVK